MLEAEVTPARRRPWRLIVLLGLVLGVVAGFVLAELVIARDPDGTVVPIVVPASLRPPAPAPAPAPAPTADDPRVEEPIEYLAAASDAPVIALGSGHHVWISRDDGDTFELALQDVGAELYDLSVDPSGRVYAMWGENKIWRSPGGRGGVDTIEFMLGIAELDGHERWRPMNEMMAAPLDTRAGWIVGTGVPVIGRDFGESWKIPPSAKAWHIWRSSIDDRHTARFLASHRDAPASCEDCGRGLFLVVAREGEPLRPAWNMLDRKAFYTDQFPHQLIGCAGFAGSTLYLVARAPKGPRLVAVTGDGKVLKKAELAKGLPADVTCTIAGNDRAAFMLLANDMIRIDTDELRVAPPGALASRRADDRDLLAVDEHGALLYVADACVWRYTESGRKPHRVVCGAHR